MHYCNKSGCVTSNYHTQNCRYWRSTDGSYAAASVWPPALLLVNVWLAVNWFGDSLDGTLARHRRQQRPRYGFYVDHVVDAYSALFLLGGLALSGYQHPFVALAIRLDELVQAGLVERL